MNHGVLGLGRWSILIHEGKWRPRNFDVLIIEFLQYAIQGKVSKILLSIPRRHGKSTLISKNFTSYFLAHFPDDNVILSSYSQLLASQFGKDCKNIIKHYGQLSPYNVELAEDSKANNKFNMKKPYSGQMLAVGAAGSIMGFGANLFVVDDPIKSPKEARSKTIQYNLEEWFEGVAKTCLETRSNGLPPIMIVIAQRLDIHDLHGIIKENEPYIDANEAIQTLRTGGCIDPNTWVVLNLPAICEDPETDLLGRSMGEVLWPEQRSKSWLEAEQKAMGSYLFNAIYQGKPTQREGNIFKPEYFYDERGELLPEILTNNSELPDDMNMMRYWDFAASGDEGDATAGLLTGWNTDEMVINGLVHGKFSAHTTLNRFEVTTLKDGRNVKVIIEQEPGSGSKLLITKFRRSRKLKGISIKRDKVQINKLDRCFDLEILAETGRIKFNTDKINNKKIKLICDELISFNGEDGGEDNIVDTMSGSARHWMRPRRRIKV